MPRVAIAASSRIAAEAGAHLADLGGNAADAAIGATVVSMCTDIGIMSPGGGAFISIWDPHRRPVVIDGYAEMPGRGQSCDRFGQAMHEVVFDYGGETHSRVGFGSVATPGSFAGLSLAREKSGRLPWSTLLLPAIDWAKRGFPLTGGAAQYLQFTHEAIYSWQETSYRLLHHEDGRPLGEGDIVFVPHLADSLEEMAREGVRALYGGSLGRRIAAGVQSQGGLLGEADLENYRPEAREPIEVAFGDWRVATVPPPSVGGPCLGAMLLLLQGCPEAGLNENAVRWLADAQRAVMGFRRRELDGAGERMRARVRRLLTLSGDGDPAKVLGSPSTIHNSAVDSDGLACSITASAGYGSGAMVPGTGIWLNNSLGETDLHRKGLGDLASGTRLASNMAPTVARRADGTVLALGSPGASRITTATAQVLWHHVHFAKSLEEAVAWPRLHVELYPGASRLAYEQGLPLVSMGGFLSTEFPARSMYFGGVQVARGDAERLNAVGDPRRGGCVAFGGRQ